MQSYTVPSTISNPATSAFVPAQLGDVWRDNLEFLAEPPTCIVSQSTSQLVPNNVRTTIEFDVEHRDNHRIHSTVTEPGSLLLRTAGWWKVECAGYTVADTDGVRKLYCVRDGYRLPFGSPFTGDPHGTVDAGLVSVAHLVVTADTEIHWELLHNAANDLYANFRACATYLSR